MQEGTARIDWSDEEYRNFGLKPQISQHRFHELSLFDDPSLAALLDDYPRRNLQAYTMGLDPCQSSDWRHVDIDDNSSGADMLNAVRRGRLWLNLTQIQKHNQTIGHLIDDMYRHLGRHCPHLHNPKGTFSALLISSPGAQVYYHLDAEPNMLWHLRGRKHVWLYPAMDLRFVPQRYIEDIYAGEVGENIPYSPEFDAHAEHHLMSPGDAASWPHNGPHRIVNIDMNVSLATSYTTPTIYRRQYVQLANRFVLRNLGIKHRSMAENGLVPATKRMTYRVVNKLRPFKRHDRASDYMTDLQLDPAAPLGLRQLDAPRLASFSSKRHSAPGGPSTRWKKATGTGEVDRRKPGNARTDVEDASNSH